MGRYETPVTITAAREINSYLKFDAANPDRASLESNIWMNDVYSKILNINVDYLWTAASDQYATKWNTSIASGSVPDTAAVNVTSMPSSLRPAWWRI